MYRTLVIDPPWHIKKSARTVRPNQVAMDYPLMTLPEISALPIHTLAESSGCMVFLWTTHAHLPHVFDLFDAWQVRYHCLMTWVKNVGFTPFSFMFSTEHVAVGYVGHFTMLKKGVRLDFFSKVREHSRKPDEFYDIVRSVSPAPRLDMFSREKREGFDQWGDDCNHFTKGD